MKRTKYIFTVLTALMVFLPSPVYAVSPGQISGKQAQWFCESFVALTGYAIPDYDSSKKNSQQYQVFMDFYGNCYRWCAKHAVDFGNPVSNYINFNGNGADYLAATVSANHTLIEHNVYGLFDVPDWVIKQLKKYAKSLTVNTDFDSDGFNPTTLNQSQSFNILASYTQSKDYDLIINNTYRKNYHIFFDHCDIDPYDTSFIARYNGTDYSKNGFAYRVTYNGKLLRFVYADYDGDKYQYQGRTGLMFMVSTDTVGNGQYSIIRVNNDANGGDIELLTAGQPDTSGKNVNIYNLFNNGVNANKCFLQNFKDGYHLVICLQFDVSKDSSNTHYYAQYWAPIIPSGAIPAANRPSNLDDSSSDAYTNKYFKQPDDNQDINNYYNVVYNIDNSVTNNYQQLPDDSTSDLLPWVKNIAQNLYNLSTNFNNWTIQLGRMLNLWFEGVNSRLENIYAALLDSQVLPDVPKDADITKLKDSIDDFQKVAYKYFPFSVPWDMYTMISFFSAPPEAPKFDVPYINADYSVGKYHIDLTPFDDAAKTARAGMRVVFDFGLLLLFKKLSDDTPIG